MSEGKYDGIPISELYKLEEKGRELASKRDEVVNEEDVNFQQKLYNVVDEIHYTAFNRNEKDIFEFAYYLRDGIWSGAHFVLNCKEQKKTRASCIISSGIKNYIDRIDKSSIQLTGKKCTWLFGVREPYNLSSFWNDITSCFHKLVEQVDERASIKYIKEGKCRWDETANKALVEACKFWDKKTEQLNKEKFYIRQDYEPLNGRIVGNKAEFVVGSASGHKTHLDLEKGEINYYDEDKSVNYVVYELLEEKGLKCKLESYGYEGVSCKGLNENNVKEVMNVIAYVTSMDFRISEPEKWWLPEEINECIRELEKEGKSAPENWEIEKCLIKKTEGWK